MADPPRQCSRIRPRTFSVPSVSRCSIEKAATYPHGGVSTENTDVTKPKRRRRTSYGSYLRCGFYAKGTALIPAADSPIGLALRERRDALIADLGGMESCTTAQRTLVDLIVAAWLQLDSVDGYLLTLPSLVDRRHRRCWQVVADRGRLASQLQSMLRDIGLARRVKKVQPLAEYLAAHDGKKVRDG
jgi:hypothetical protein